ncbi:hypothetical protein ACEWY4_007238 [Coilia grayii]|uniref:IRF tryptophan pentad repeat domain-containing protein n=1 Tax=Coilia grayii TaxID=363190 RepID=A0ABD1KG62_9TELE
MKGLSQVIMPVDRMRMRPWLEEQINSGLVNGLVWIDKQKKIFQIPWMHAARHGWELDKDAPLFKNWAIHTGKYHPGVDEPDPKTWKANFRCAMNSLPDIEEVKDKSSKKGSNAIKVYRMLSTSERARKKEKKKLEKKQVKEKKRRKPGDETTYAGSDKLVPEAKGKVEHEADSTMATDPQANISAECNNDEFVIHEMPDVCAVVEVSTEDGVVSDSQVSPVREASPVSSSTVYPLLQVSASSSSGESDDERENRDQDPEEWDMRCLSEPQITCSVVRFPSCKPPSKCTFFNSEKINFKVTSCQEESPIIAYNVRPRWSLHLATRPMTGRMHSDPQAHFRYSFHMRHQTSPLAHNQTSPHVGPQNAQQVATEEIHTSVPPPTNTQVPTQANINVRAQTISHMFPLRSPHVPVQSIAHLRPQTHFHAQPRRSLLVHPSVAPRASLIMCSPISPETRLQMLYQSSPYPPQQSGHPKQIEQTGLQLSPPTSLYVSPRSHPNVDPQTVSQTPLHGSPHVPAQGHFQKSSQMRVLTRPDPAANARDSNIMPHHSPRGPITKSSQTSSSLPDGTHGTDGRASVIVNTGVTS